MNSVPSILIIRLSSLGDVVLTLPVVTALRTRYPEARIDFLVRKEYAPILHRISEISNVIELDTNSGRVGLRALRGELRKSGYSHVLDLHNNFRSQFLRRLAAERAIINKRTFQRWLLVNFKINVLKDEPDIVGRYFEVAKMLGVFDDGGAPTLPNFFARDKRLVAVAPGARHWNKRWPVEHFVELIKTLIADGRRVELFGSKDEREIGEAIMKQVASEHVQNLMGELTITETIDRMSRATLAITNDSGLMHVASALGIKTVAIFGPTVREFGFFPRARNATVIENVGLPCRPCTAIGRADCPEGHFLCLKNHDLRDFLDL